MMAQNSKKISPIPVRMNGEKIYDILIRSDFLDLPAALAPMEIQDRRVCVVTDTNVATLYLDTVKDLLKNECRQIETHIIPAGEEHKTMDQILGLYEHLIKASFDRHDLLIALGGGVIGDMTGFTAATYLRGIRFVQIPTTLLSQVDSSIGGKTGVDFNQYKNMIGAFHMPSLVYINLQTLKTLDEDQFAGGMGEVLKHGLIRDESYYGYVIEHMSEIEERDLHVMSRVVEGSVLIKRSVVEKDPEEKGERAILNFGHTIGHAIEKLKQFKLGHGQCVSLGCVAAAWISWQRGMLEEDEFYEIRDMMVGFQLPITFDSLSADEIIETTRHDKKMNAGTIRFILLEKIGKAVIDTSVTPEEMRGALREMSAF